MLTKDKIIEIFCMADLKMNFLNSYLTIVL